MKIQFASDLHLEFPHNEFYLQQNPLPVLGDILILAGDIVPFKVMFDYDWFFDRVSSQFKQVYWIPGNHEYYYSDATQRSGTFTEQIRPNVYLINNTVVEIEHYQFLLTTLWSKIDPVDQWAVQQNMSDFQVIRYNDEAFTGKHFNQLHEESMQFLKSNLKTESSYTTIVVTHHVPTMMHYPERFKGSILNQAFATELFDFIASQSIDYWIYGHHHQNTPSFTINNTLLCTNQLGYVHIGEGNGFDAGRLLW